MLDGSEHPRAEAGIRPTSSTSDITGGNYDAVHWSRRKYGIDLVWAVERRPQRHLAHRARSSRRQPPGRSSAAEPDRQTRKTSRTDGKSDPLDALAVARVALREPDLPVARHTPATRASNCSSKAMPSWPGAAQHRTAIVQRLLWRAHELDPTYVVKAGALSWARAQHAPRRIPGASPRHRDRHRPR